MDTNANTIETLTPEEFAAKYLPVLEARDADANGAETAHDYFIVNRETGKMELHFDKATYTGLTDAQRQDIKRHFLWGRNSGCWISRCKEPNLYSARHCAEALGLRDAGKAGERLSYAEQMERRAERAERRAERYEGRADAAWKEGERLQQPINHMRGDVAFFTQPNINTSAGRAFSRKRERMYEAYEAGFKAFNKSAYWKNRAATAQSTAQQKELQDKGFVMRRITERESDLRKLKKSIEAYESYIAALDKGETPRNQYGWEINTKREALEAQIETWEERMEAKLDELGFYQDCLDRLGGVAFSQENVKPGYIVHMKRWGDVTVVSTGPKNFTHQSAKSTIILTDSYAEIEAVVKAVEAAQEQHPFQVGETFTCHRWNSAIPPHGDTEKVTYTIIRATDKSVTLRTGEEKPIVRKPVKRSWRSEWQITVTDWSDGTWFKAPAESK